jgi:uncharacterized membrane protein
MDQWVLFGIIAAICFGASALFAKVALSDKHANMSVAVVALLTGIGIMGIMLLTFFATNKGESLTPTQIGLGLLIGVLWAIGNVFIIYALKNGADLSRMAPLYNTNTLIAVFLSIILLKELPNSSDALRVIFGAIMIFIGGILITT